MLLAVLVVALMSAPALAETVYDTPYARGAITLVNTEPEGMEPRGISVEGPSGDPCANAGYFQVKEGTEILRDGKPTSFDALEEGLRVEAYYEGEIGASCPPVGVAGRIVILDDADTSAPGTTGALVETGGASPAAAGGAALLTAGLLLRALTGYVFR